ncbi:hypothetical protein [Cellulomonas fimi]|uniref:hypothetical protein n=1 Tax=Cellulomonas fimi TaxID=1708 RepID=UPI002358E191|nr:hypothetical protein [Cellulomonas fimi]
MIDELATELGVEVRDGDLDDGDRPGFGLRRRDWVGPVLAEVAVVVEWQLSALLIPGRGDTWPYVAVRYDAAMDDPAGRRSLEAALADVRKDLDGNASRWWPFWRYVEPADGVVDPDALIEACIEDLRELWAATAPILDSIRTQVVIDEPSD